MAVSLTISEIFNVKERSDLEIWAWGRSRSLKMARFDRPCMTFYGFAIVTIALEVTQGHWNWCHSKAWMRFPIRLL